MVILSRLWRPLFLFWYFFCVKLHECSNLFYQLIKNRSKDKKESSSVKRIFNIHNIYIRQNPLDDSEYAVSILILIYPTLICNSRLHESRGAARAEWINHMVIGSFPWNCSITSASIVGGIYKRCCNPNVMKKNRPYCLLFFAFFFRKPF